MDVHTGSMIKMRPGLHWAVEVYVPLWTKEKRVEV